MAKARLIKRVEVTWIDATLKQGWLSLQQAEKFAKTPLVVQIQRLYFKVRVKCKPKKN